MAELLAKDEAFCKQNSLFAPGTAVLAACSGGPDSLALLHLLLSLRERWQLQLAAAHFEHGIRGAASLADAAFVRDFCQARGVPFYLGQADVPGYASAQQLSLETAARTLRYRFLRSTAAKLGEGTRIATAHQADDQAETVLMRILRGTGVDGLAGIAPRAGELIRPLLCATRAEIEAYCRQQGLEPRHDATNDVPDCTRNRLRLELLPQLAAEYNPDISAALCRLAAIASEESSFIASASAAAWEQAVLPSAADSVRLSLAAWRPLPRAMPWLFASGGCCTRPCSWRFCAGRRAWTGRPWGLAIYSIRRCGTGCWQDAREPAGSCRMALGYILITALLLLPVAPP